MNSLVETFRRDPHDRKFETFEYKPGNSPGCPFAESNYRDILANGVLKLNDFLFDPNYSTSILAGLLRTSVILPEEWFGSQTILEEKLVLAKGLWRDSNPGGSSALCPGASSALVEIDNVLFIARPVDYSYVIHRPVVSDSAQQMLRRYLQVKTPDFFMP